MTDVNETSYMKRALQLARRGFGDTHPNPMVGAVIVADGEIIAEGWHRLVGQGHAEVNAVNSLSLADRARLAEATMYVTLEPCSHYGRTPPCAKLLIDSGVKRVVVATPDPFEAVAGRGIAMMREAGISVSVGLCGEESRCLNAMFITAVEQRRPWLTLKWAQSADGFIDHHRTAAHPGACVFSDSVGRLDVHRLRHAHDAILVGSGTVYADRPGLDNRLWPGGSPRPVVLDRRSRLADAGDALLPRNALLLSQTDLPAVLAQLYEEGIRSVLVEGGAQVLTSFMQAGLWDALRVETSSVSLGADGSVRAPQTPVSIIYEALHGSNRVRWYSNNPLFRADHPMVF